MDTDTEPEPLEYGANEGYDAADDGPLEVPSDVEPRLLAEQLDRLHEAGF